MPKRTVNKKKILLKLNQRGLKRKNSKLVKKGLKTPNKVRKARGTKGTKRRKRARKIKTGGARRPQGSERLVQFKHNAQGHAGDQRRRRRLGYSGP